jgi:hypothetical protein
MSEPNRDADKVRPRLAVHFSSKSSEHYTPRVILDAVVRCLGPIELDPCSNSEGPPIVDAERAFTREHDGLRRAWHARSVYMNPPYGRVTTGLWVAKLVSEFDAGRIGAAIALLPARTDTRWFHLLRRYPCCFYRGRVTFGGNVEAAPFPSCVSYLGSDRERFAEVFSALGDIWACTSTDRRQRGLFEEGESHAGTERDDSGESADARSVAMRERVRRPSDFSEERVSRQRSDAGEL